MALLFDHSFAGSTLPAGLTMSANGIEAVSSDDYPYGIAGRIYPGTAPDGSPAVCCRLTGADAEAAGALRSEFSLDKGAALVAPDSERWYVWDVWLPDTHTPNVRTSICQIHDDPDDGEPVVKAPNLEFITYAGEVSIDIPKNCPTEQAGFRTLAAVPLVTGRWVQCAMHAKWETDATGFLEIAFDGRLVGREWNRACHFADIKRPYLKLGLYDTYHGGLSGDYSAWYRNLRIYGGRHSASEVLGGHILPRVRSVR